MSRTVLSLFCGALVGWWLNGWYGFPEHDYFVVMTKHLAPGVYQWLKYSWIAMLYSTPTLAFAGLFTMVYVYVPEGEHEVKGALPPFPSAHRERLALVLGEVHHRRKIGPADRPHWLTIPERGLYTGIAAFGSTGSGKTAGVLRPLATQVFSWCADDPIKRIGGLVLEVKGDFCYQVRDILRGCGRADDYLELSLDCKYRYNPLEDDRDAFAQAFSIAMLINQLWGKSRDQFWPAAYTNLVKFIIMLHKAVDGYCTLLDVYLCAISPTAFQLKIAEGDVKFQCLARTETWVDINRLDFVAHDDLAQFDWMDLPGGRMRAVWSDDLGEVLDSNLVQYTLDAPPDVDLNEMAVKLAHFEAVKRWYANDWMAMHDKLRTSIVEGISVFLSLFDTDTDVKRVFCPPKECYDPVANADGRYGVPLPKLSDLIEQGKVLALNFPLSANPATSRMVACLLKQDYQRAMLMRIPQMTKEPERYFRPSLFLCDEYHSLATVGESDPSGDEKFFALSRQSKCIPIVATQSISSLQSTLPGNSWRTLLQCFRTRVYLATSDHVTAKEASEDAGRIEQAMPSYSVSESGNDVRVSALSGRTHSHKQSASFSKTYSLHVKAYFEPRIFMRLANMQAVCIPYDGVDPLPPTLLYLKPYWIDRNLGYWDQKRKGLL
jgi:hypothetical protein